MNESLPSSIEIELTKRDIVDFNFTLWRKSGTIWIMLFIWICFLAAVIVQISEGRPFVDYAFYLIFDVFILLLPILIYYGARRSFDNKFLQEKKAYVFSSQGFTAESPSTSVKTSWEDIKKVIITKKAICLFIATNAAHVIPRRYLAGHEEIYEMIQQFTSTKSRKAGKSRLLRNIAIYVLIFLVTVAIVQFFLSR